MSGQTLLVILLVGLIAGWLAGQIVQGTGFGNRHRGGARWQLAPPPPAYSFGVGDYPGKSWSDHRCDCASADSATYLSPRAMVIGLHNLLDGICASSRSGAIGGLGVAAPFLITVDQLAAMRTDG